MEQQSVRVNVEAAELVVTHNESITPGKLYRLADQGWTIVDAFKTKDGGFNLLMTRKAKVENFDVHLGTAKCPQYCNCVVV